jgi:hypothetical protein
MHYRGWTIKAYQTFLGFFALYTSPLGEPHSTSPCFPSDRLAIGYAQGLIDSRIEYERLCAAVSEACPTLSA